ncbi:hypothetical protein [Variovorax sp. PBL-H6]|uniref:hypothetical protein n=1 Tax=Variovorax sp. PBL-H6 TaxID=434009 RepID=UPI0013A585F4|nr:hypothetical protein [Variovorax sp. PBL-H6]
MRVLTADELILVSGGEDGGCTPGDSGADGNCAAQGESSSESIGSLPEVTVNANADNVLGDSQAEQMMQNIELANNNPFFAAALFFGSIITYFNNAGSTTPIGNPMGDPSPAGP